MLNFSLNQEQNEGHVHCKSSRWLKLLECIWQGILLYKMNCEFCKFTEICTKLSHSSQMIEFRLKNQNLSKSHKLFQSLPRVNLDDGRFSGVLQNYGGTESWAGLGTWIQGEDFFSLRYFVFDMKMKTFAGMMAKGIDFFPQECFRVFSKDEDGCIPADEIK